MIEENLEKYPGFHRFRCPYIKKFRCNKIRENLEKFVNLKKFINLEKFINSEKFINLEKFVNL